MAERITQFKALFHKRKKTLFDKNVPLDKKQGSVSMIQFFLYYQIIATLSGIS